MHHYSAADARVSWNILDPAPVNPIATPLGFLVTSAASEQRLHVTPASSGPYVGIGCPLRLVTHSVNKKVEVAN